MNNIEYVLKNFEGHTKEILIENFCPTEFDETFKEICCEDGEEMNCEKCWKLKVEQDKLEDKGDKEQMKEFTKEDLKTSDIVVTRGEGNAILVGSGFKRFDYLKLPLVISTLEDYNEDLIIKGENIPAYDIMKVYRITKESEYDSLEDLMNTLPEGKVELVWERKREIDWSKVPKWTRVQVRDRDSDDWMNRYFICLEYNNYPYLATQRGEFTYEEGNDTGWRQIRIYDESDIKEEWYK